MAEMGVSHICPSHNQVSSLNLQVSSKSQVTVMKVKSLLGSSKSQVKSCEILRNSVCLNTLREVEIQLYDHFGRWNECFCSNYIELYTKVFLLVYYWLH